MGVQPFPALGTYRWTPYYNKKEGGKEEKRGKKEGRKGGKRRGKIAKIESGVHCCSAMRV